MSENATLTRPLSRRPLPTHGPEFFAALAVQARMSVSRKTTSTIIEVLRRWAAGDDSATIAAVLGIPEADVCRIIAADQDVRRDRRAARAAAHAEARLPPF